MNDELKPIRSEADYERSLAEAERLWGAKSGTPEGDRLDVLATLIDAWESQHYPMDPPDPIEAIKFRMEQQGLTRKDLEPMIGTRTRVAEVLNRKRGLSISMIRRLNARLGISAEVLELDGNLEDVADLEFGIVPLRLLEGDLRVLLLFLDGLHDLADDDDLHLAGLGVQLDLDLLAGHDVALERLRQRVLEVMEQLLLAQVALRSQHVQRVYELFVHLPNTSLFGCRPALGW